jgi:hypothetical protein
MMKKRLHQGGGPMSPYPVLYAAQAQHSGNLDGGWGPGVNGA